MSSVLISRGPHKVVLSSLKIKRVLLLLLLLSKASCKRTGRLLVPFRNLAQLATVSASIYN